MPDDKNYGVTMKYDPDFRGPLKRRSCTDVICLFLFLIFLACWGFIAYLAFHNGDPSRLLKPTDSRGRKCGLDENVENKPYLFFFDLTRCISLDVLAHGCPTPQVCVSSCPSVTAIDCTDPSICKSFLICLPGITVTSSTTPEYLQELYNNGQCARMYFESSPVYGRCIPSGNLSIVNGKDVEIGVRNVLSLANAKEIGQMVVEDMSNNWPWILGALVIAMLACFLYIVLMRWFAGILVWVSLAGVVALLSYCIYASYMKYASLNESPLRQEELDKLGIVDSLLATKTTWMVFLVASAVVLVIVLLILLFLRKRIIIAIALIEESSKAVANVSSSLLFPLAPWVLQSVVLIFFVVVVLFLASSSDRVFKVTGLNNNTCTCNVTNGDICHYNTFSRECHAVNSPDVNCTADALPDCQFYGYRTPNHVTYYHVVNIFGLFWSLAFISGLGQMVLAGTFASWYWAFHKSDVPYFTVTHSIGRTLRYHMGTVAFGSLILAICQVIRVMLEYLDQKLKKYDNMVVKAIMCCLRCFFWCLEKFIIFINRNAYIMCAVHGKNFCRSAKDAFNLLMRNIVRVFVLDKVTDFLLFLGKLMITAGMVALSFFVFDGTITVPKVDVPHLNYYLLPVVIVGIATYCIATLFFNVYSMAIDTLFLCFLEDCERNDGSQEKPYFMPKSLRKILHKHNRSHLE